MRGTHDRLLKRARTNWRLLLAWLMLAGAASAGLALGIRTEVRTRVIERERPACYRTKKGAASRSCERLAELVADACKRRPAHCPAFLRVRRVVVRDARQHQGRERTAGGEDAGGGGRQQQQRSSGAGGADGGSEQGVAHAPGGGGGGGVAPDPGGGDGGGGAQPPRPGEEPHRSTPVEAIDHTIDRVEESVGELTDSLGLGRPVPDLPGPCELLPSLCS